MPVVVSLMIHAPRHVDWPNDSAWTGCGGEIVSTGDFSKVKEMSKAVSSGCEIPLLILLIDVD